MVYIWTVIIALGLGVGVRYWLAKNADVTLPWTYPITASVISIALGFLWIIPAITNSAKSSVVGGYHEYINGYEKSAKDEVITCRGGREGGPDHSNCDHEYDCGGYEELVSSAYTDSEGNYHPAQYEHHDIYCPYATREHTYRVGVTYGFKDATYEIEDGVFDKNPRPWGDRNLPSDVRRGPPGQWLAAKARIDSGNPGPATGRNQYDNYILPAQTTILKRYSKEIEFYKKANLLPKPPIAESDPIHDHYRAYKFITIDANGPQTKEDDWQQTLMWFNAALGTQLQGDLNIVAMRSNAAQNPDVYINALAAYWQNLGKRSMSKNGIVIALGIGNNEVKWARAETGMPKGNESMLVEIREKLIGAAYKPEVILGSPRGHIDGDEIGYSGSDGLLDRIMLQSETSFSRIQMTGKDKGGAGYEYLLSQIEPSFWWKVLMVFIVAMITAGLLVAAVFIYTYRQEGSF